jgi:tetratricopeptide (TPR) repeat protein
MPTSVDFKTRCLACLLFLICYQENCVTHVSSGHIDSQDCDAANDLVSRAIDAGTAGDIQKAWSHLRTAVHICPNNAAALGNLGYLHAIHGDSENAADYLKKSISVAPSTMEPWINLGNIFKEELDRMTDSDGADHQGMISMVLKMYRTAYRLLPSVDVTANLAGLYAMERDWERAALFAEKSLSQQYTEEAFCVIMKALDNICHWEHPMRDMPRLISILERNVGPC